MFRGIWLLIRYFRRLHPRGYEKPELILDLSPRSVQTQIKYGELQIQIEYFSSKSRVILEIQGRDVGFSQKKNLRLVVISHYLPSLSLAS
jgi:hypothetical protein